MRRIIILIMLTIGHFSAYCQTDIYDGDWYHSYNGICGLEHQDDNGNTRLRKGVGKDVYRIHTENDVTTVRVKRQYPCDSDYQYWECSVTRCDEYSLEWYSEINRYKAPDNQNNTIVIEYYCNLRKKGSTLIASIYYRQLTINGTGYTIKSTIYGEEKFSLYKDGNDW